jgi:hypothetical protein
MVLCDIEKMTTPPSGITKAGGVYVFYLSNHLPFVKRSQFISSPGATGVLRLSVSYRIRTVYSAFAK